ncbi:MAG: TPM domain-containing protein [Bacteriovoracaceae bacterium]|nr:TPM domain-containing protein [Bacteriovoracaceae bacterium]
MLNRFLPIFFLFSCLMANAFSLELPTLRQAVEDQVGLMSSEEKAALTSMIENLYNKGGPQIQVLTIDSLEGVPIEEYSIQLAEKWKIGREKQDDGIMIVIAIKDRKIRIEVGQGLEGAITDVEAVDMIYKYLVPNFKNRQYGYGIGLVVEEISKKTDFAIEQVVETKKPAYSVRQEYHQNSLYFFPFLIFLMILYPLYRRIFGQGVFSKGLFGSLSATGLIWLLLGTLSVGVLVLTITFGFFIGLVGLNNFLFYLLTNGRRSGYRGGSMGGLGGRSSWGGGGGGFSGGGASGSW